MVAFFCPPPMVKSAAAGAPATCDFIGRYGASINAGDPAADRDIFLFLSGYRNGSLTLSGVSIGGVAAKIHGQLTATTFSSAQVCMALVSARVPGETIVSVSPTFNNSPDLFASATYRVTGLQSDEALSIYTYDTAGDDAWSTSMDVAAGGFSLAGYEGYGHTSRVLDTPQMDQDYASDASNTKIRFWSNLEEATLQSKSFAWSTTSAPSVANTGPFIAASFR